MELYHVLNRGVEKRSIVTDDHDRLRFIHDLFVFNSKKPVANFQQPARHSLNWTSDVQFRFRDPLVRIYAYCLMNNHYHLLLSPRVENGVSLFMQKLNMGYAKYFNERHGRTGGLWQGKYKKIAIERDAHFNYIPYYINLNPLDYSHPEWRSGGVKSVSRALAKLSLYRWSSHLDYLGTRNFPSILDRSYSDMFAPPREYKRSVVAVLKNASSLSDLEDIFEPLAKAKKSK
jgi:putative transposase